MTLYLGVDGGGSGCRAAVADEAGRVLGRGEGPSANIWTDPDGALSNILSTADAAAEAAGGARPGDLRAVLGIAGANLPEAGVWLLERLPFRQARVVSDALIALKGALGDDDGIVAIIGTGSVFGVQQAGRVRMIGGWGLQLGDRGSGAWMGRALLEAALLAHDGLADAAALLDATMAEHGGPAGVVAFGRSASPADFARSAPRIVEMAAAGDPAAERILVEAEASIAHAIDRLIVDGPSGPICFLGGLAQVFADRLAGRYSGLIRAPRGTALDGALMMARELP